MCRNLVVDQSPDGCRSGRRGIRWLGGVRSSRRKGSCMSKRRLEIRCRGRHRVISPRLRRLSSLITNDSEKYQGEASVWVDGMLGLIAVTGVLTLAIDYSNTKPMLTPMLLGFAGGMIPVLFRRWSGKGRRKENL